MKIAKKKYVWSETKRGRWCLRRLIIAKKERKRKKLTIELINRSRISFNLIILILENKPWSPFPSVLIGLLDIKLAIFFINVHNKRAHSTNIILSCFKNGRKTFNKNKQIWSPAYHSFIHIFTWICQLKAHYSAKNFFIQKMSILKGSKSNTCCYTCK